MRFSDSAVGQHLLFNLLCLAVGENTSMAKIHLALGRPLRQDMTEIHFLVLNFACSSKTVAFCCRLLCLHLWHFKTSLLDLGAQRHRHEATVHRSRLLYDIRAFLESFFYFLQDIKAELGVSKFPTAETDGHFNLIAFV